MPPEEATAYVAERHGAPPPTSASTSMVGGLARSALQGAAFGFGDEATAAVKALPRLMPGGQKFGETYEREVGEERQALTGFREEHPALALGTELATAVGTGLAGGAGLRAAGVGAKFLRGGGLMRTAAEGAASGGLAGAGGAQGGVGERARGAGVGALLGGTAGVAAKVAGAMLGAGRSLASRSPATAGRLLRRTMAADETAVPALRAAVQEAGEKPVTLMDVGGRNLQGLARGAQSIQGSKAKNVIGDVLDTRQAGQRTRILEDLTEAAPELSRDALDMADEVIASRQAAAAPAYEKALAGEGDSPRIRELLSRPSMRRAVSAAEEIAEESGESLPVIPESGPISARTLHNLKMGLDRVVSGTRREPGIQSTFLRERVGTMKELLDEMDSAIPGYREDRKSWAGDSAVLDAIKEGREQVWKMDPRILKRRLSEMTESEAEAFSIGALDDIRQRIAGKKDHLHVVKDIFGDDLSRQRIALLVPDEEAASKLLRAGQTEITMGDTPQRVIGGSPTSRIADEQRELGAGSLEALTQVASGRNPLTLVAQFLARGALRLRGMTKGTADEIAQRLTAQGDDLTKLLDELEEATAKETTRRLRGAGVSRGLATGAGLQGS